MRSRATSVGGVGVLLETHEFAVMGGDGGAAAEEETPGVGLGARLLHGRVPLLVAPPSDVLQPHDQVLAHLQHTTRHWVHTHRHVAWV